VLAISCATGTTLATAWDLVSGLALRRFPLIGLDERTPDHSTISRTRRLIDIDPHREVFAWVLALLAEHGLLKGQRMGIDATTLEANAAMPETYQTQGCRRQQIESVIGADLLA
jgi:transposase